MKAMIFAAGMGTRLRPVTDHLPKALVKVGEKPMLQRIIEKLAGVGCREIVVNIHHFPDQIREFLERHENFGISIHISDESDMLLDTGGGVLKASRFLSGGEPVILHNVDILSDLDLRLLVDYHLAKKALATLVVRDRKTMRYLLFNEAMRLSGWENKATGEIRSNHPSPPGFSIPMAFSGIHVVDPKLFTLMTGTGKFSIIDTYLELAGEHRVFGFLDQSDLWMDIGKPEQLASASRLFP